MACLVLAVIVALAQPIQAQNEPPDTQQIRTELGKVVTDLRAAMAQLARIEAEAAALPKTFTAGGQTQNRWNQLNGEKERWTTEQNNALERYDQLVVRSEPLPSGNAAIADLLTICTQLIARNDVMLKTAQSKLSGIERTLRSGPSTFAKGNEIEVWQTQLNRERDYWTGNLATLSKEHEKLAAQFTTLKVHRTAQAAPNPPGLSFPAPAPAVGAAIPASVPSVPANDKTFALIDDFTRAIRVWHQYKKEGNEVEATIQSDKIEKMRRTVEPSSLYERIGLVFYKDDPEKALARAAKYRADYPAIRAKLDKEHALEVAIAARRKEEADKESAERRRVDEEKAKASAPQREVQMKKEAEEEAARMEAKKKEAAMKKPIATLEDAVERVKQKFFADNAETKVGRALVSTGGLTPAGTKIIPVRFANKVDFYFFQDDFDEWSFYRKGDRTVIRLSSFR